MHTLCPAFHWHNGATARMKLGTKRKATHIPSAPVPRYFAAFRCRTFLCIVVHCRALSYTVVLFRTLSWIVVQCRTFSSIVVDCRILLSDRCQGSFSGQTHLPSPKCSESIHATRESLHSHASPHPIVPTKPPPPFMTQHPKGPLAPPPPLRHPTIPASLYTP